MNIQAYVPAHTKKHLGHKPQSQFNPQLSVKVPNNAPISFAGSGLGEKEFDCSSLSEWSNLFDDIATECFNANPLSGIKSFFKMTTQIAQFVPALIMLLNAPASSEEESAQNSQNPLLSIYQKGKDYDKNHKYWLFDIKAGYLFAIGAVEGIAYALEHSDRKNIRAFNRTVPPKLKAGLLEGLKQTDGLSDQEKESYAEYINHLGDQFFIRSLPTLILSLAMFDSSQSVREKAYERFSELDNKKDKQGHPYIDPVIAMGIYSMLTLDEISDASESSAKPQDSLSKALEEDPEFRNIATTAKRHILSSIISYINDTPLSIKAIEQLLDNASLEKKKLILQDLRSRNIFARITNPAVSQVCERMYDKGYDLKNGELLPVAYLSPSQPTQHLAQAAQPSASTKVDAPSTEAQDNIPDKFKTAFRNSLIQDSPHGKVFLFDEPQKMENVSTYAEEIAKKFSRDSGSSALIKTIKTKEDVDNLFSELAQIKQANPKVIVTLDKSTDRRIRQSYWNKLHLKMEKPLATFVTLFTPDKTKEYAPYEALVQSRVSAIRL